MAIQLPPQEKIQNIINQVIGLIENGTLGERDCTALTASLGAAGKKLNQGEPEAAAGFLEAFVDKVEAKVKSGKLPPAEGLVLVKAALNVLVD